MEMGFVKGRKVTMVLNAPLQDPIKFSLMDYEVSLRRAEANLIEVGEVDEWDNDDNTEQPEDKPEHEGTDIASTPRKDKIINIALIGNPNCGRTCLCATSPASRSVPRKAPCATRGMCSTLLTFPAPILCRPIHPRNCM